MINPYSTHQGLLLSAVVNTKGPVLEMGAGWYSTPILHAVCRGRKLVSVDQNEWWFNGLQKLYESPDHSFVFGNEGKTDLSELLAQPWDVVFIDHGHGLAGEPSRGDTIRALQHATYIVVHDWETASNPKDPYKYQGVAALFKHCYVDKKIHAGIWTAVLSNQPVDHLIY